jgi:hypothetical protein
MVGPVVDLLGDGSVPEPQHATSRAKAHADARASALVGERFCPEVPRTSAECTIAADGSIDIDE